MRTRGSSIWFGLFKGSHASKEIPIWLFKAWQQTTQVSEGFDAGSTGICAERIDPQRAMLLLSELSKNAIEVHGDFDLMAI